MDGIAVARSLLSSCLTEATPVVASSSFALVLRVVHLSALDAAFPGGIARWKKRNIRPGQVVSWTNVGEPAS